MAVLIRKANLEDMEAIHILVKELAAYERGLHKVSTSAESYKRDFHDKVFDAFVVEKNGEIVGMALYFLAFSTWRGRMLYLEDFIVRESERGSGIGALLFETFMEEAKNQEVPLVKWQVLEWNETAIKFYKKYQTDFDKEWIDCKIYLQG